jgi:hypothetical protein
MPYTEPTIRQDLQKLNIDKWDWAGVTTKMPIDPKTGKPPVLTAQDVTQEMGTYCWCAYDKAFRTSGDQVIGRESHLNAAGLYDKVSDIVGDQTLATGGTKGNLLKMDKWARVVNDSWLLGGVHRGANFRLVSPRVMENLWNFKMGAPIVTAREMIGLLYFGYQIQQVGPYQVLSLVDRTRNASANLVDYDRLMQNEGTIRNVLKLVDKSKLKIS